MFWCHIDPKVYLLLKYSFLLARYMFSFSKELAHYIQLLVKIVIKLWAMYCGSQGCSDFILLSYKNAYKDIRE